METDITSPRRHHCTELGAENAVYNTECPTPVNAGLRDRFGHPIGLVFLAGTEFWERVSYVGMQALLLLYMVQRLLLPGHVERIAAFGPFRAVIETITGPLSTQALASQICGLYMGLVFLTPILGGFLGDRLLGRKRAVTLGALLMTAGHLCMAFDRSFLVALFLLILGEGALKPNLVSQVGSLYAQSDQRRERAFQIYYAFANSGAFVAPLVTGMLSQVLGWQYGFGFAGIGMLAGLVIYLSGARYIPADTRKNVCSAYLPLALQERRVVLVTFSMLPIFSLFWIAQSQIWNTYNLWALNSIDLTISAWRIPVAWLQSFDGIAAVAVIPPVLWFWRQQAHHSREPDDFAKLGIGCLLFGAAVAWLAASAVVVPHFFKSVPLVWALGFHILSNLGWAYYAPTVVTILTRAAPTQINGLMIGIYNVSIFAGCTISGRLGGFYGHFSSGEFWLLHAALVACGGGLIFLVAPTLRRELGAR